MKDSNYQLAVQLRHELHAHPELSNQESWTKAHLMDFLRRNTSRIELVDKGSWFYGAYRAGGTCRALPSGRTLTQSRWRTAAAHPMPLRFPA